MNVHLYISKVLLAGLTLQLLWASPAAYASNSGLDTPTGVTSLPFSVQGTEIMTLTDSGLGIGTTQPQAPLDVDGGIRGSSTSTVAGQSCSPHGAIAYDMTNDSPVYCGSGGIWISMLLTAPSGEIAYFLSLSCPTGWIPANGTSGTVDMRSVFPRGLDNGRGIDSGRSLGSLEYATEVLVDWGANNGAYGYSISDFGNVSQYPDAVITGYSSGGYIARSSSGSSWYNLYSVRPINVALLACQKT